MLTLLFLSLAVLSSGATVFLCSQPIWWLVWMIPSGYVGFVLLYFVILFIASLCFSKEEPAHGNRFCRCLCRWSMQWLMPLAHVKVETSGTDLIPKDSPCILVSNHLSDFDPMTVLAVWKREIIFISKESNFKLPIVGPFIRKAGYLAIDRENGVRALRTLKKAADRVKNEGVDVGIYPEGTRSKTGELLEFKTGAFYLAKKAEVPVVVMCTQGTDLVKKNSPFRKTTVKLDVLEVLSPEKVKEMSLEELAEHTRTAILTHLGA